MKSYYLVLLFAIIIQSCSMSDNTKADESENDFEIKSFSSVIINDSVTKQFIKDYISLPQNINRKVFTILFDQRSDTLNLTIWRYLYRYVDVDRCIGYTRCEDRIILFYSPFTDFISIKKDKEFEKKVNDLYQSELEYYKTNRHELVMWQLQYSYYQKNYNIVKSYHRIVNTYKPLINDSIKVDIQWPAD